MFLFLQTKSYFLFFLVMGVNDGCDTLPQIREARHLKVYRIGGRLGRITLDHSEEGKIIEKTTFHHVTDYRFSKVLARTRANFQKALFNHAGVDIQSQEAYDLASKGMLRPKEDSLAMIYSLKLVDFKRPYFTLEVQAINETDLYFKKFVHELGYELKSGACFTRIRKVRDGHFTLYHALLMKHWTLENVLNNIAQCRRLVSKDALLSGSLLAQKNLADFGVNQKYLEVIPSDLEPDGAPEIIGDSESRDFLAPSDTASLIDKAEADVAQREEALSEGAEPMISVRLPQVIDTCKPVENVY